MANKLNYFIVRKSMRKQLERKEMFRFYHTLVKVCQHSHHLDNQWQLPPNTIFPLEILQLIRSLILDTATFISFSKAFNIPFCQDLVCQILAEQRWLEDDDNSVKVNRKSIAETEYTKIHNDLRYFSFLFPTTYKITKRDNGIALTSYKKHLVPLNYEAFFSTHSLMYTPYIDQNNFEVVQNGPSQGRHFVYTPYRLVHIYNPEDHKHFLKIHQPLPNFLKKKYKTIETVLNTLTSKSVKIEPWTLCHHQTKGQWEPCQEWVDFLVQIYNFQQETSIVLKQLYKKVS